MTTQGYKHLLILSWMNYHGMTLLNKSGKEIKKSRKFYDMTSTTDIETLVSILEDRGIFIDRVTGVVTTKLKLF